MDYNKKIMERLASENAIKLSCYSGKNGMPCLIYQTVITLDGLILSLYGPEVGMRDEITVLRSSRLSKVLNVVLTIAGEHVFVFGDKYYVL